MAVGAKFTEPKANTKLKDFFATVRSSGGVASPNRYEVIITPPNPGVGTNQEVKDIWFLIMIMNPREVIDDLPSFKKLQKNSKLTTSQIKLWATTMHSDKNILKVWNWKLSVTSDDAKSEGWLGKGIGDYMRKKEEELFLKKR